MEMIGGKSEYQDYLLTEFVFDKDESLFHSWNIPRSHINEKEKVVDGHLLNETEGGDRLWEQRIDGGVIEKEQQKEKWSGFQSFTEFTVVFNRELTQRLTQTHT